MRCPKCDSENNDSAKFCKKCGAPLDKTISHEKMINSMGNKSGSDNKTKYIIVALVIVAIALAGAFAYIYTSGSNQGSDAQQVQAQNDAQSVEEDDDEPVQAQSTGESKPASSSSMSILGGSFSTGSELNDKTYASIYVGSEHAGEAVTIQIYYSRDGNTLNNGNMVPKTVTSSGYIEVASADPYKYFPDFAEINLYDGSGSKLLDTKSVSLNPESGTQSF